MAKDTTKNTENGDELPSTEQVAKDLSAVTKFRHTHKQCRSETRIDIRGTGDPLAYCRQCNTWLPVAEFE